MLQTQKMTAKRNVPHVHRTAGLRSQQPEKIIDLQPLLTRFVQLYGNNEPQDNYDAARLMFENELNLALFSGTRTLGGYFYVTKANHGNASALDVEMFFSAVSAEQLLNTLQILMPEKLRLKTHRTGFWSLLVDGDIYVIRDLKAKIRTDVLLMTEEQRNHLAELIGVESTVDQLQDRLVIWYKEVGHAPR